MKKSYLLPLFLLITTHAIADKTSFITEQNDPINVAGIHFNAAINLETISWLSASITEIQNKHPTVKAIDLYINSGGGDMDAAYIAYEMLRNSKLKINAINSSLVGSSATLLYCASENRYAMPMASFFLHPASISNLSSDNIKPDEAKRMAKFLDIYNQKMRNVYKKCTKIPEVELIRITASESNSEIFELGDAEKYELVNRGVTQPRYYPLTYFITE